MLTEQERRILAFEGTWWTHQGAKAALVLEHFGLPPERYTVLLAELVDRPEALEAEPLVVRRLRRLRDRNRRARQGATAAATRSQEQA